MTQVSKFRLTNPEEWRPSPLVRYPGGRGVFPSPLGLATPKNRARVVLICPVRGDAAKNLVLLPGSLHELLDLGYQKFGFHPTKILTKDGALIEDLAVIRDGDNLVLATDDGQQSEEPIDRCNISRG
ncbi:Potassium channel AKT1 [Forsythia ovata]|uniref:Potassium channel AKT1 n=1 Tax=Forsythia ovata TaxID=205694 RepID=A0ABD1SM82_9LAMI